MRQPEGREEGFDTYFVNRHVLVGRADRLEAARTAFKVNAGKPTKVDRNGNVEAFYGSWQLMH